MKYQVPKIIKEKKAKEGKNIKFWKIFGIGEALVMMTSVLAVIASFMLNKLTESKEIYLPKTGLQDFFLFLFFIVFFILIFFLYKKLKKFKGIIYKIIFIITVFWGGVTVLDLFIPVFGSVLVVGLLIVIWLKIPTVLINNILMILGLAGISIFLGLEMPSSAIIVLMLIFSIYDFIAVYKIRHMVFLAKEMVSEKVIIGLIIPKELKYFKNKLKEVKLDGDYIVLGWGDVVFPNLLAASVIPYGVANSLIIILFSSMGYLLNYWILSRQEEMSPIPALPSIALFSIIGYFVTLLIL